MTNEVKVKTSAPGAKQATGEIKNLHDAFTRLQKGGTQGFAIGAGAAITTKAFNLAGEAIHKVEDVIGDSVTAYREQEVATGRLTQSLQQNVAGWDGDMRAMDAATRSAIKLGFTDTETADALSLLVAATHNQAEALKVLGVAQDLARFKNISLGDAASALTSIEAGRARGLAALGINVKDYATTAERLAAVEKLAGGQAAKFAGEDLGKLDVALAKVDQAEEKLGKGFSKMEAVILPALANGVSDLTDEWDANDKAAAYMAEHGIKLTEDNLHTLSREFRDSNIDGNNTKRMFDGLRDKAQDLDHWTGKLTDDFAGLTDAIPDRNEFGGMAAGFWDITKAAPPLEDAISGVKGQISDLFDAAQGKGKLTEIKDRIHDLRKELAKTTDKGDAEILKGQLIDLYQQGFTIAQNGPDKGLDFLKQWRDVTADTDKKTIGLIDRLILLAKKQKELEGPFAAAAGGPGGPQGHGGTLTTHSIVTLNIHITGAAAISERTLAYRLGPYLTKYLQSHNLVPHQASGAGTLA